LEIVRDCERGRHRDDVIADVAIWIDDRME
jgi:hypothetical protein